MRNPQRPPDLGRTLSPSEKRFLEGLRKDQKPSFIEEREEDERPTGITLPIA